MSDGLVLWLHLIGATLWVGPQVFMFVAVIPAVRSVSDGEARYRMLQSVTARFGWLGGGALLLLLLTGIENIRRFAPPDVFDVRYGYILTAKLTMVGAIVLLTAFHTMVVGPQQLRLQREALDQPGADLASRLRSARMKSMMLSTLTLLLSILVLLAAALLRTRLFSDHVV